MDNLPKKLSEASSNNKSGEQIFADKILLETLQSKFHLQHFRDGQTEIIQSILSGRDTLAIMPTGGGKSLCYQLPSVLSKGTAIIFSPLISLMKDQVDSLTKRNISAGFLNSSLHKNSQKYILENLKQGKYKLLFVAPERLNSKAFLRTIENSDISFIVIDEAHCISEWGHDFRPMYLNIPKIFNHISRVPIAAFTATATPEVREDIVKHLKMENPEIFVKGFRRTNLAFKCEVVTDKKEWILKVLKQYPKGSKIIYAGTRNNAEEYSKFLNSKNIETVAYHGGLYANIRKEIQEKFISNQINTIVATNAFGMGIDKPDVRLVIHVDLPSSLEAYYQEAGRAGRDGLESECSLLYSKNDEKLPSLFIFGAFPDKNELSKVIKGIYELVKTRRNKFLSGTVSQFSSWFNIESNKLRTIFKILKRKELIEFYDNTYFVSISANNLDERANDIINHFHYFRAEIFNYLLNQINGKNEIEIDLSNIAQEFGIGLESINTEIQSFESLGLIKVKFHNNFSGIKIKVNSIDEKQIEDIISQIEDRKIIQIRKADKMLDYLKTDDCKQNFILEYFGEINESYNCKKCTNCNGEKFDRGILETAHIHNFKREISKKAIKNQDLFEQIAGLAIASESLDSLSAQMQMTKPELANLMQAAIEDGFILTRVKFIPEELFKQVSHILEKNPNFRLSQIRERLEIPCDFPELRIVVAFCRKNVSN